MCVSLLASSTAPPLHWNDLFRYLSQLLRFVVVGVGGGQLHVRHSELEVRQRPVLQGCQTRRVGIFATLFEEELGVAGVVGRVEVGKQDDHDVAGKTNQDVPDSVQKRNPHVPPDVAECLFGEISEKVRFY